MIDAKNIMMKRYNPETVKRVVAGIAKAAGVSEHDSVIFSDSLVDADIHGMSTHGVSRVNVYIRRIQRGLIDPRAEISIDRKRGAVIAVDAGNGLGQVQACKVLEILTRTAKLSGIASATIRNSQHFGSLSYYCNKAARKDMILFAMTNAEPAMSPQGGCQAYFGTNPMAVSFPTGKEFNIKIDLSTSVVARGNIIAAHKKGKKIPPGWALDPEGNPTMDPEEALSGTVLTMAGHKGYALALMVELFSGVLSGAAVGHSVGSMYKDMNKEQNVGHFFCLMDIDAFIDVSVFKKRVDKMIDEIKACRKQQGVKEILIPGERSFRRAVENREKGICIEEETIGELKGLCDEFRIPFTLKEEQ
ncbi:putative oxidoreductase YjmC [bacterium BMS3Bbin06]|nr:putative oxidoreductase YjmC [bacterium BMS3Abin08]GBE34305.1 putative oxidoreductase YjmC [bacterium BMS3Bbin06]HDY70955.1 Ldh family oxidoreductase [Nitrospirota bacterium]